MNIGRKLIVLKDGAGFKNWKEFGDFVGLSGDWCNDLSKKTEVTTVDITRLQRIASKFNVTMNWLLSDIDDDVEDQQYPEDDISTMLSKIQDKLNNENTIFEGTPLKGDTIKLAQDSIDVVKKLIRQNL